jgi:hypothetical protein
LRGAKLQAPGHTIRHKIFDRQNEITTPIEFWGTFGTLDTYENVVGSKFQSFHQYMFSLCIENTIRTGYFTEKITDCILHKTIPIYWGAKKSLEWLNPKAFLYLEDTSEESIKKIIEKIIELDNDNDKYIEMFNEPLVLNNKIPDEISISGIREKVIKVLEYKKI